MRIGFVLLPRWCRHAGGITTELHLVLPHSIPRTVSTQIPLPFVILAATSWVVTYFCHHPCIFLMRVVKNNMQVHGSLFSSGITHKYAGGELHRLHSIV